MEKASPEELQKEISRLWEKVGAVSAAPADPAPTPAASAATANEVAWETVAMLKSQYRRQEARWRELLEAREQALAALKERQALLEKELGALRRRARAEDELVVAEVLDVGSRMEAAQKALAEERAAHEAELRDLHASLDAARASAAAAEARWKEEQGRWQQKERQYLLDLQERAAPSAGPSDETRRCEEAAARLSAGVAKAKEALEQALAELQRERQARQEAQGGQARTLAKIAEMEGRLEEFGRAWQEESGKWRELWDQARSAREEELRQARSAREEELRQARSAWEEGLRQAQEAWRSESAEQLGRSLKESAAAVKLLAAALERIDELERRLPVPPA
ncbi:MAG: hypothetical protein PHU21_13715, partial [Elusimicrobia bacterium]|nr:hypothetical protein [Elusimicrobiota bacterium]